MKKLNESSQHFVIYDIFIIREVPMMNTGPPSQDQ